MNSILLILIKNYKFKKHFIDRIFNSFINNINIYIYYIIISIMLVDITSNYLFYSIIFTNSSIIFFTIIIIYFICCFYELREIILDYFKSKNIQSFFIELSYITIFILLFYIWTIWIIF